MSFKKDKAGFIINKIFLSLLFLFITIGIIYADQNIGVMLEPWIYKQDFETVELSAWASYPIWQDAAYDEKIRVNKIVPGEENVSLEQKVIPYSNVDNYASTHQNRNNLSPVRLPPPHDLR